MMAKEYKAAGGGYKDDKKDEKAKHLDKWTEEDWQTSQLASIAVDSGQAEKSLLQRTATEMHELRKARIVTCRSEPGSR